MRDRTSERSAACATCGKTFARSDTLLRHEKSHLATEDRGPVHRVTNGTFRACCSCAQARARCSGGGPCGRCKVRSLECTYPAKRRRVAAAPESPGTNDQKPLNIQLTTETEPSKSSRPPGQFQELVFSAAVEAQPPAVLPSNSTAPKQAHRLNVHQDFDDISQSKRTTSSEIGYTSNLNQPLLHSHNRNTSMDLDSVGGFSGELVQYDQYGNPIPQQEYQTNANNQVPNFNLDPGYDESMNLNWIPLSVFPSPYGDLDQDFAFLIPPMTEHAGISTNYNNAGYDLGSQAPASLNSELQRSRVTAENGTSNAFLGYTHSPGSSTSEPFGTVRSAYSDGFVTEPRKRQRKASQAHDTFGKPRITNDDFQFPTISELTLLDKNPSASCELQYPSIRQAFGQLCIHTPQFRPFATQVFPSARTLNACIDLYFENFHANFPLLHRPTFGPETPWMVFLAVATIGSNFVNIPDGIALKEAFQELLRRSIVTSLENDAASLHEPQLFMARVLNLVSMSQSDRTQIRSLVPRYHAELSRSCLEAGFLQRTTPDIPISIDLGHDQIDAAWRAWIREESIRRVGYFIWLLDCAFGYLCNSRPLCNMDDARADLPCSEAVWDAVSPQGWLDQKTKTVAMPSLCAALEEMYGNKRVATGLSEMSQILLIHALYSRTWEVGTHIKQPLSEWRSTGNARGFLNTPSKDDFWLPLYPLYANWRNSACDCLDVLHWKASSIIAQASGNEHHGVLQLHLARIILLTPFQELQDLIFFKIDFDVGEDSKATYYVHDGSYQRRDRGKANQIRTITRRWLCEDQHKARLAIIHAGSIFWHVRRYSSNSFFEPLAVYMASIVLWTYGSYKSAALERQANNSNAQAQQSTHDMNVQPTRVEMAARTYASSQRSSRSHSQFPSPTEHHHRQSQQLKQSSSNTHVTSEPSVDVNDNHDNINNDREDNNSEDEDEDEEDQPEFIHLDRPCDDEIVQHFVRNGHNMTGHMSNVGDICKTPNKVLVEGSKLLKSKLSSWGVSRRYYDTLIKVVAASGRGNISSDGNQNGNDTKISGQN